jgi:signal transduction histidine kinase
MFDRRLASRLELVPVASKGSFSRWVPFTWILPAVVAVAVVVERWNEPHPGRTVALVVLGLLPLTLDDIFHARVQWLWRVPSTVWSLPAVAAVFALIWHPVNNDWAPFLLVLVTARAAIVGSVADGIVVLLASTGIMLGLEAAGRFRGSFIWVIGITLAWTGAFAVRSMYELLTKLEAAQADLAERAAADERQRIAREVHDVIAHSLSVAALHITGARMALRRSPEEATEALEQAERLARDSLAQVRSVIGVLSPAGDGTAPAMPTASDIPALVAEFTDAGVGVALEVHGNLASLSPALGLALYRVTQESLSNVIRHAPGKPASVGIRASPTDISLTVTNPISNGEPPSEWGRGIRGMRERAVAQHGTFDAGARDGRWIVRLVMPAAETGGER